jgi:hypothetical protein
MPSIFLRRALVRGGGLRVVTAVWRSGMQRLLRTPGPDQSRYTVNYGDFIRWDDRPAPE